MRKPKWGQRSSERPRIIDSKGSVRGLSGHGNDVAGPVFAREGLARIAAIEMETLPVVPENTRLGACVGGVGNFVAMGRNYSDQAHETGQPEPAEAIISGKASSCICGPYDDVPLPPHSTKLDWEPELAIVIGEPTYCIEEAKLPRRLYIQVYGA